MFRNFCPTPLSQPRGFPAKISLLLITTHLGQLSKQTQANSHEMSSGKEITPPPHVSIDDNDAAVHSPTRSGGGTPKSSSGWDGKLRVEKKLELSNPEALSDPDYSDEENVAPKQEIPADEGNE